MDGGYYEVKQHLPNSASYFLSCQPNNHDRLTMYLSIISCNRFVNFNSCILDQIFAEYFLIPVPVCFITVEYFSEGTNVRGEISGSTLGVNRYRSTRTHFSFNVSSSGNTGVLVDGEG